MDAVNAVYGIVSSMHCFYIVAVRWEVHCCHVPFCCVPCYYCCGVVAGAWLLLLANVIGDRAVLSRAMELAKDAG